MKVVLQTNKCHRWEIYDSSDFFHRISQKKSQINVLNVTLTDVSTFWDYNCDPQTRTEAAVVSKTGILTSPLWPPVTLTWRVWVAYNSAHRPTEKRAYVCVFMFECVCALTGTESNFSPPNGPLVSCEAVSGRLAVFPGRESRATCRRSGSLHRSSSREKSTHSPR